MTLPLSLQQFPLTKTSIAFMIGGWNGAHAHWYADNYDCHLHIFEPQSNAAARLIEAFKDNPKAQVHQFGLGMESGDFQLSRVGTDGASFVPMARTGAEGEIPFEPPYEDARLVDVCEFLKVQEITKVLLALINCEGYEFRLLPYLVETGLVKMFRYLMVQFHPRYEGADRLPEIREMMSKTHDIRDDYEPQWIVWQLKKAPRKKRTTT